MPAVERKRAKPRPQPAMPGPSAMRRAWKYARRRGGLVSFAVVDTKGRMRTRDGGRLYASASVVKAMLLVAELRRLAEYGLPLDPVTEDLLEAMITWSDNDAADSIYARVGDPGLVAVAEAAKMRRFTVAGYWGNAQVTAADLAHFFSRVRRLLPRPHRRTGLRLLASVIPGQRWGLPKAAAGGSWTVYFKGGWRETESGELVHQAGWLKKPGALNRGADRRPALAALRDPHGTGHRRPPGRGCRAPGRALMDRARERISHCRHARWSAHLARCGAAVKCDGCQPAGVATREEEHECRRPSPSASRS